MVTEAVFIGSIHLRGNILEQRKAGQSIFLTLLTSLAIENETITVSRKAKFPNQRAQQIENSWDHQKETAEGCISHTGTMMSSSFMCLGTVGVYIISN
jgi:hypothetical protein